MIETSNFPRPDATYLQGIAAYVTGTPAGDLKVGDTMIWNGGSCSKVHFIERETPAYVWILEDNGYTRRMKKTRIVARPLEEMQ